MFEEFKNKVKNIKAPNGEGEVPESINTIIEEIRKRDEKDKKMFKGTHIMFFVMFVLYTLIFVIIPDPDLSIYDRMAGGFFILSFGIMIPILQQNYYERKGIDYQASTIVFLGKAEGRLKFWNKKSWLLIPFLLFIAIAESLALFDADWLLFMNPFTRILVINAVFWLVMLIGLVIARLKWKREKAVLLEQVRELKESFY